MKYSLYEKIFLLAVTISLQSMEKEIPSSINQDDITIHATIEKLKSQSYSNPTAFNALLVIVSSENKGSSSAVKELLVQEYLADTKGTLTPAVQAFKARAEHQFFLQELKKYIEGEFYTYTSSFQ